MPKDKKRKKKLTRALRRKLKRRNAIEPTIDHLKHDHRMDRCYLKGEQGDKINALAVAMGLNLRKLLAGIRRRVPCAVGSVVLEAQQLAEACYAAWGGGWARPIQVATRHETAWGTAVSRRTWR